MIRDRDTLAALIDNVSRVVREGPVSNESEVAERDAIRESPVAEMKALGLSEVHRRSFAR
jgi:hypothetical protein